MDTAPCSDAALIAGSRTDPELFGAIFDRHFAALYPRASCRSGGLAPLQSPGQIGTGIATLHAHGPPRSSAGTRPLRGGHHTAGAGRGSSRATELAPPVEHTVQLIARNLARLHTAGPRP